MSEEQDFTSPLLGACLAMYEMFTTLMEAGFTEDQALKIVTNGLKS